jgi:hypothetical protein
MRKIAELNMLLRVPARLPEGLKLATEEFREGWSFSRSLDARRLERKILSHGWNFIRIVDGSLRSGVGETSQEAIASALKLALRRVSPHFNVAEVDYIQLTRYPWFFLARVRVLPYLIQQGTGLPVSDDLAPAAITPRQKWMELESTELFPQFACAMPQLKQMLISSAASQPRLHQSLRKKLLPANLPD